MSNPFRDSLLKEVRSEIRSNRRMSIGVIQSYDIQTGRAIVRYEDIWDNSGDATTQALLYDVPVLSVVRDTEDLQGRQCVVDSVTGDGQNWCVLSIYPVEESFHTGSTYSEPVTVGPQPYDGTPLALAPLVSTGVIPQDALSKYMYGF